MNPFDFGKGRLPLPLRPAGFREASEITSVHLRACAPIFASRRQRLTGARANGVRYEKKIHEEFLRRYPANYLPSPWFEFWDGFGHRWCQPDGLLIDVAQGLIVIVEVKHHHTGEAWWKLHKLYFPVVRALFGTEWEYRCLEVVRFYDPSTLFPAAKLVEHPHLTPPLPIVGVHICKPTGASK